MANTPTADDIRGELEKQIADLKGQITQLSDSLAERASDAAETASEVVDEVRSRASGAAKQVRRQAHVVSEAIKENPGTAATVLSSAGLMGAVIGFAIGYMVSEHSRRW